MNDIQQKQHNELHSEMISLIEQLSESISRVKDANSRTSLASQLQRIAECRMDAEFLVEGPDFSRSFMEDNEWQQHKIQETLARLFTQETMQ